MEQAEPTTTDQETVEQATIDRARAQEYWRRNVRLIAILLGIWFAVSFGAAILLANPLAEVSIGQLPLSFWFAQQGSIYVFVILIFVYAWRMNQLDREYGVED